MWADAVFEGGGVKGIGLVGALSVAEERGYRWKKVAGTSAGAMIASLVAAGYTARELVDLMMEKHFVDFLPRTGLLRIPYAGPLIRLWVKKGIFSGNQLERWMEDLLAAKGVRTFGDLPEDRELAIIATDISRGQLLVLPGDLEAYGHDPKSFPIARAVRMSTSIPYLFEPVKLRHKPSGTNCLIVDGGVLSNYPVWLFDREVPRWPTFGFRLVSDVHEQVTEIEGPLTMLKSILFTMMDAHDNRHVREQDQVRTIKVPALDVKLTDFSISREKKEELFRSGVLAAEAFFDSWTFERYLASRGKSGRITLNIRPGDEAGAGAS
ncbi:patatin-like phospholipase family protein [Staphylospora marina]|uniref:patatin-like phospholipase family protein n=1 Tax=Staphylospora marina TaxID=2490858 RepID=UPI000F5C0606|nr:patatin-like phospholipase family protein [Staphylospora marina]